LVDLVSAVTVATGRRATQRTPLGVSFAAAETAAVRSSQSQTAWRWSPANPDWRLVRQVSGGGRGRDQRQRWCGHRRSTGHNGLTGPLLLPERWQPPGRAWPHQLGPNRGGLLFRRYPRQVEPTTFRASAVGAPSRTASGYRRTAPARQRRSCGPWARAAPTEMPQDRCRRAVPTSHLNSAPVLTLPRAGDR